MPEYIYALHDFLPENDDEVGFRAGERIEVIEKDDQFGDGWWQGRNIAGKDGLFPVSYTTSIPPTTNGGTSTAEVLPPNSALQPLPEELEIVSPSVLSPIPKPAPGSLFLHIDGEANDTADDKETKDPSFNPSSAVSDREVMRATMTDVQKAIEQLGRGALSNDDQDGARSFSFASTKEGGDTETDDTDFDLSDLDGSTNEGDKEDWHKNARRKLAAKARRAVEQAEQLEAIMNEGPSSMRRQIAPPIEVEMSDESDVDEDGDFTTSRRFQRRHPGILEEDENEADEQGQNHVHDGMSSKGTSVTEIQQSNNDLEMPPKDESQIPTATAQPSFHLPVEPAVAASTPSREEISQPKSFSQPAVEKSQDRLQFLGSSDPPTNFSDPASQPAAAIIVRPSTTEEGQQRKSLPLATNGLHSTSESTHSDAGAHPSNFAPQVAIVKPQVEQSQAVSPSDDLRTHPSEWSLEQVVEWLKGKGFDQDVCDKFVEQEITGDVLLDLDANVLKTEIGIVAYGKRIRIANAIADLRRPTSFEFPVPPTMSGLPSPIHTQMRFPAGLDDTAGGVFGPMTHSRTQSYSQQSHHSFSGMPVTTQLTPGYTQSVRSSVGSRAGHGFMQQPQQQEQLDGNVTKPIQNLSTANQQASAMGLGINLNELPTPLSLSSSDGVSQESTARAVPPSLSQTDEDRGHVSEGEVARNTNSMRRRIFGRSQDSAISLSKTVGSKETSLPSPTVQSDKDSTKEKDSYRDSGNFVSRHKPKKAAESGRHGERLSIFGGTFKHRKPPPSDENTAEKSSKFTLSSIRKSSSVSYRTSTPLGSPKAEKTISSTGSSPVKDKGTDGGKRKRPASTPHPVSGFVSGLDPGSVAVNGVTGIIQQGQSILDQIGEPDNVGWMRKRGVRYNSWKLRYFVLQGPHLYCLRSSSKTETRLKDYINVQGYKVTVDENIDPGRYGFRIDHDHDKTHYFSSDEQSFVREWMKAIMKATIDRDYTRPVISSCNIPTIPLVVAQTMNPAPRPPSPSARDATQRAMRREDTSHLSTRDARVLMGIPTASKEDRARADSVFGDDDLPKVLSSAPPTTKRSSAPPARPSREIRRSNSTQTTGSTSFLNNSNIADDALIQWANTHLSEHLQVLDPTGPLYSGLALLRLAESIKGQPASPPVPDLAFPADANDEKLDGLVKLFDFLLDNEVKIGSVSINDVRQGKKEKIIQLVKALKLWEDKRKILSSTIDFCNVPSS